MRLERLTPYLAGITLAGSPARAEVVINEVMFHPGHTLPEPENLNLEWIELHNTDASTPVDISGWALDRGVSLTFPEGTNIAPGGFLLAAASDSVAAAGAPVVEPWAGRLSNDGEAIRLVDASGATVDEIVYSDEGEWATKQTTGAPGSERRWIWESPAGGGGASLERRSVVISGTHGQNWAPGGTPGMANDAATDNLAPIITDITHHPAVPRPGEPVTITARVVDESASPPTVRISVVTDFDSAPPADPPISLHSEQDQKRGLVPTDDSVGIAWREPEFDDSSWHPFTLGVGFDSSPKYLPYIGWNTQQLMRNINSTVYLRARFQVDEPSSLRTLTFKVRDDDGYAAFLNGHLVAQNATPLELTWNSRATSHRNESLAEPLTPIDITEHLRRLRTGENVLAVHGLNSSTGSSDFLISYELEATGGPSLPDDFPLMLDDGQHGDGEAGDGVFGYIVDGQPAGQVVGFRIGASDGAVSRIWPEHSEALYQHDEYDGSGDIHPVYRLVLRPGEAEDFRGDNSDDLFDATFIAGDQVRYAASSRARGNSSRFRQPFPRRVDLPHDRPLDGGATKLNLNTVAPELQLLGMRLFNEADLATPTARAARLLINGENDMPGNLPRVHLQPLGDEFLDEHFPPEERGGNMYKMQTRTSANWDYRGEDPAPYQTLGWEKRNNASAGDWSDLIAFHQMVNTPLDDPEFAATMEAGADMEQWLRWFAMNSIMANREGGLAFGRDDDYSIYLRPTDNRWLLLPHDLDSLFGMGQGRAAEPTEGVFDMMPRARDIIRHPAFVQRYYAQIRDLLDTVFEASRFEALVDGVLPHIDAGTRGSIKTWMAARQDYLRWFLGDPDGGDGDDPGLSIQIERLPGGSVRLSGGVAPEHVDTIAINGQPVEFDPVTGQWSLVVDSALEVVGESSIWKFLDDGSAPPANWAEPGFDDSSWSTGTAPLGYGDTGELATQIERGGSFGFGQHVTAYFRTEFEISHPSDFALAGAEFLRDDGVALYLNGIEVARDNLDPLADHLTLAASEIEGPDETSYIPVGIDPSLLRPGANTLAAEVHISDPNFSPDLRFDARMELVRTANPLTPTPGLMRYTLVAFDADGTAIGSLQADTQVFVDPAETREMSGTLVADTTLGREVFGHLIASDLVVPPGTTLTIAPGAAVVFSADASLIVHGGLQIEGTRESPVWFDRLSGSPAGTIDIVDATEDCRIAYASIRGSSLRPTRSTLVIEDSQFSFVGADAAQLRVERCRSLVNTAGPYIYGRSGGRYTVRDCRFYDTDQSFLGLEGTALIEGNTFELAEKSTNDLSQRPASAIALSGTGPYLVSRNVFVDLEHVLDLTGGARPALEYNTVYQCGAIASLYWDGPGVTPAEGLHLRHNLISQTPVLFINRDTPQGTTSDLSGEFNLSSSAEILSLGASNIHSNPDLPGAAQGDFTSPQDSPTRGASVPPAVTIAGEPPELTPSSRASIAFAGPGMVAFRYRLDGGPWSEEIAIPLDPPRSTEVAFVDLPPGLHLIEAIGRDLAGRWQSEDEPSVSRAWTVDPSAPGVVLNEIGSGWVEVLNVTDRDRDISGRSLSSASGGATPLPAGTVVPALGTASFPLPVSLTSGDVVTFDGAPPVTFGAVPAGFTLTRTRDGRWTIGSPTRDAPNAPLQPNTPSALVINEWLPRPDITLGDDFVELLNPTSFAIDLGGLGLSDDPDQPGRYTFPPHTFLAPTSFLAIEGSELGFGLAPAEPIILSRPSGETIARVEITAGFTDVAYGLLPDGNGDLVALPLPTPGYPNAVREGVVILPEIELIGESHLWRYLDNAQFPASEEWRNPGFDDSNWSEGAAQLGYNEGDEATLLLGGTPAQVAHPLRSQFEVPEGITGGELTIQLLRDDGAAVYIDGEEVVRDNLPDDIAIELTTLAVVAVGGTSEDTFFPHVVPAELAPGTHTIAASIHNSSPSSVDISFDLRLSLQPFAERDAAVVRAEQLLANLRVTELHYHPPANAPLEFVEIQNVSETLDLDLAGVKFTGAIEFTFPPMVLAPGGYALVVQDVAAFEAAFGLGLPIAGAFTGRLANGGETVNLVAPEPIPVRALNFQYDDSWQPATDGAGASLNIVDPLAARDTWRSSRNWIAAIPSPGAATMDIEFDNWAAANGVAGATGDLNGDGVPHLVEYALGLDPSAPPATPLTAAFGTLELDLPVSPRLDVDLLIERSADGVNWEVVATRIGGVTGWSGTLAVNESPAPAALQVSASIPAADDAAIELYRLRAVAR